MDEITETFIFNIDKLALATDNVPLFQMGVYIHTKPRPHS